MGQNLSEGDAIDWGALEDKSVDTKTDSEIETDVDSNSDEDYMEVDEIRHTEPRNLPRKYDAIDGKAFFEGKSNAKKKVQFSENVEISKGTTSSNSTPRSHSVNSSDLNENDFSSESGNSDEGENSDTEIMQAIFGDESDQESDHKSYAPNVEQDCESSDQSTVEEGAYDSDEENEILEKLMNEGQPVSSSECEELDDEERSVNDAPSPKSSSEEPPENPGQLFPSNESSLPQDSHTTAEDKLKLLPKSELGDEEASVIAGKYIPPAMRKQVNALERSVRGFLNRLSGSNLYSISQEFIKLYSSHPRKEVSTYLTKSIFGQILLPTAAPILLIEDYSCLLVVLHQMVSEDISQFIIEEIILKYFKLEQKYKTSTGDCVNPKGTGSHFITLKFIWIQYTVLCLLVGHFLGRNFRGKVPLIGCLSNRGFRKNEKNQKR